MTDVPILTEQELEGLKAWRRRFEMRRVTVVLVAALFSGFVGWAYGAVFYGEYLNVDDAADPYRGFRTGAMIGFIAAAIELYYIRSVRRSWIRRVAFLPGLIVRIVVITIIIRAVLLINTGISNWLANEPLYSDLTAGDEFRDTLFSLLFVLVFVTLSQLSAIIGFKRFVNLVVGRYFKPVAEERIFLFVDLIDSTPLARRLGDVQFHQFLSDFFHQLDMAVVRFGGEIVSYVGDCVIVTWPITGDSKRDTRVLRALYTMRLAVKLVADDFRTTYGTVPTFRAALHGGHVVVGECGDSRRQVTYLGDTVNVTGRLEALGKELGEPYLISSSLAGQLSPPDGIGFQTIGASRLKGLDSDTAIERIVFTD